MILPKPTEDELKSFVRILEDGDRMKGFFSYLHRAKVAVGDLADLSQSDRDSAKYSGVRLCLTDLIKLFDTANK